MDEGAQRRSVVDGFDGGWILAEGLAYGTSVARVMNDTETLDCVLDLVVDCTPVEPSS